VLPGVANGAESSAIRVQKGRQGLGGKNLRFEFFGLKRAPPNPYRDYAAQPAWLGGVAQTSVTHG